MSCGVVVLLMQLQVQRCRADYAKLFFMNVFITKTPSF